MNRKSTDERIAMMLFSSVYPLYVNKIEKKGRSIEELNKIIEWLCGFNSENISTFIQEKINFENFFNQAKIHPNAHLITGIVCGVRVEEITNPLTQKVRYLDKLVDELAKGKSLDKILRK